MRSFAILVLFTGTTSATVYPSSTPPDTIAIEGRVSAVASEWQGHRIISRVAIEQAGSVRTVLVPGGSVDGIAMRVAGAPRFIVGEHARVRVRSTAAGLRMVGLGIGKAVLP